MSVKINVEVPDGPHCNIEVPLEAIGVTSHVVDAAMKQQRITEFTSKTVAAVLQEVDDKAQARQKMLPIKPPTPATTIPIILQYVSGGRQLSLHPVRSDPLQKSLVAFAQHFGLPVSVLRMKYGGHEQAGINTPIMVSSDL